MKSKLKTIIVTFVATTAFWILLIAGVFWWDTHTRTSGVNFLENAASLGYLNVMAAWNKGTNPATFTVAEILNITNANSSQTVLLERQVPPSGNMWIAIKEQEPTNK